MAVAVVVTEILLLEGDAHHRGEDEDSAKDADGVGPHAHEDDLKEAGCLEVMANTPEIVYRVAGYRVKSLIG